MRKSILAFIATVSIGAASAETYTHTAHANDLTNEQQNQHHLPHSLYKQPLLLKVITM